MRDTPYLASLAAGLSIAGRLAAIHKALDWDYSDLPLVRGQDLESATVMLRRVWDAAFAARHLVLFA